MEAQASSLQLEPSLRPQGDQNICSLVDGASRTQVKELESAQLVPLLPRRPFPGTGGYNGIEGQRLGCSLAPNLW